MGYSHSHSLLDGCVNSLNQMIGYYWSFFPFISIQELLDKVVEFREEAQEALVAETPDSEQVETLIEIGLCLDVDLPEIPKLKQVSFIGTLHGGLFHYNLGFCCLFVFSI